MVALQLKVKQCPSKQIPDLNNKMKNGCFPFICALIIPFKCKTGFSPSIAPQDQKFQSVLKHIHR